MVDPISAISAGISIGQGALQFLGYIKSIASSDVISAYFTGDGQRIDGNEKLEIEKHPHENDTAIWWFCVNPIPDYIFVRMPVAGSGLHELLGKVKGEENPDYRCWRWVALPKPNVIVGGNYDPQNAKVAFIIVGYKPKALITHFSSR